jgi:putative DNA-invertase from lambdoid prophage Rac
MKSEGKKLGRPKGSFSKQVKLTGKDEIIREFIRKRVPDAVIARILEVNRITLRNYANSRELRGW